MIKLISFTKIHLLITTSEIINLNAIILREIKKMLKTNY